VLVQLGRADPLVAGFRPGRATNRFRPDSGRESPVTTPTAAWTRLRDRGKCRVPPAHGAITALAWTSSHLRGHIFRLPREKSEGKPVRGRVHPGPATPDAAMTRSRHRRQLPHGARRFLPTPSRVLASSVRRGAGMTGCPGAALQRLLAASSRPASAFFDYSGPPASDQALRSGRIGAAVQANGQGVVGGLAPFPPGTAVFGPGQGHPGGRGSMPPRPPGGTLTHDASRHEGSARSSSQPAADLAVGLLREQQHGDVLHLRCPLQRLAAMARALFGPAVTRRPTPPRDVRAAHGWVESHGRDRPHARGRSPNGRGWPPGLEHDPPARS